MPSFLSTAPRRIFLSLRHSLSTLNHWIKALLDNFRLRLAYGNALPQLALLGIVSGLITGVIAVAFRLAVELPLTTLLPNHSDEGFESLSPEMRLLLPIVGALAIIALSALIARVLGKDKRSVGVGHVVERYQQHQARLPAGNAVMQFFGGIIALLSGHSVGREGPAIHLGAASASLVGQRFGLPNNSLRTLVGCGVAAAISASFNTPLAGVIFAMEVVLMEYTVIGFVPVILAAVAGALVSRVAFGAAPAFEIPVIHLAGLMELPYLAACGVAIGLVCALILTLHVAVTKFAQRPMWINLLVAGFLAGGIGMAVPEVMGVGYDTLELAMLGELGVGLLLTIAAAKLLLSTTTIALGIPGGSIGPALVIGACLGGCLGVAANFISPENTGTPGFYATLGMGAAMAAVLNAPLAALVALMELTYNPGILMPAMLVIVVATMTTRMVSRLPGIFLIGRDPKRFSSPVYQMLSGVGVTSIMNRNFLSHSRQLPWNKALEVLEQRPEWLVVEDVGEDKYIIRPSDLARFLEQSDTSLWEHDEAVDLLEVPGQRWRIFPVHPRATLQEALSAIRQNNGKAAYITRTAAPLMSDVAGIITREQIDNYYQ
ncbi:MAG: chloride channel protein [Porticoccaceae bacterium]